MKSRCQKIIERYSSLNEFGYFDVSFLKNVKDAGEFYKEMRKKFSELEIALLCKIAQSPGSSVYYSYAKYGKDLKDLQERHLLNKLLKKGALEKGSAGDRVLNQSGIVYELPSPLTAYYGYFRILCKDAQIKDIKKIKKEISRTLNKLFV